jgi:hypothetical protein
MEIFSVFRQLVRLLIVAVVVIITVPAALNAQLKINEFMASNQSTVKDPDFNSFADWIEIYNPTENAVSLENYFITDDFSAPAKYKIPSGIVQPKGYLILWADDQAKGLHANFKLSASGEAIALLSPDGRIVDSVTFGEQGTDISMGRYPDGGGEWFQFFPASPGRANSGSAIYNRLSAPVVATPGGFYKQPVFVSASIEAPQASIHFTMNGKIPTLNDSIYKSPVKIDSTAVIRFRAFKTGYLPGETVTNTYFINEENVLPVFSLVTDPDNLFSDTSGIYVAGTRGITGNCSTTPKNWNQDWERPVNIQLFEIDRSKGFHFDAGLKIYGGCSRIYDMKSLALYFRSDYGPETLNYRLFNDIPLTEYNNFILRSGGQDWWRTMFRDEMAQTLIMQGMDVDCQAYRPSLVFINGNYWGIHNIREKYNEHYLHYHHGTDENNIDLIQISKTGIADLGDLSAYTALLNFLNNNNIARPENYEYIKSIVDINEYIDYQIAEIYGANGDWPGYNMKFWREKKSGGKWRWLIFDLDYVFGGNAQGMANINTLENATAINGPDWPNPPWSTLMLRKLLENSEFRNEFIQRAAVHMNTTFEPGHVLHVIDSIKALIAPEIQRHKARWAKSISMGGDWNVNVQLMRDFAQQRPKYAREHFIAKFGLSGVYSLTINRNIKSAGKIFLHNSEWTRDGEQGVFFSNIPLRVRAVPMPGYKFVRWEGASGSASSNLNLILGANSSITAIFEKDNTAGLPVVINEINYKSSPYFDTDDWIEFYNPSDKVTDLSGYQFSAGSKNSYAFEQGCTIEPSGYLVVCRDSALFNALWGRGVTIGGVIPFGLSGDGEKLTLKNNAGEIIDEVQYMPSGGWPAEANGAGSTLALVNPQFDNGKPENWKASPKGGTPGRLNDVYLTGVKDEKPAEPEYLICRNYPNPFNPSTRISYSAPASGGEYYKFVSLRVYDVLGKEVAVLVNETQKCGAHEVVFNGERFSSGVYFYRLQAGNNSVSGKMLLIK